MKVTLVVAHDRARAIGRDGDLPWRLRDDLKHFKRLTMGKPIVMGRTTFESIGRPLPGRRNIVLSRQPDYAPPGVEVVDSPAAAQALIDAPELMVIGGAQVYAVFLPQADCIWLSEVDAEIDGADCWFPELDSEAWSRTEIAAFAAGPDNDHAFRIVRLDRKTRRASKPGGALG